MGSRVGSRYTATSLLFLAPVARRVMLGIWSMCLVFTSSTINLLHLVPNMTCLWLSHWLQNSLLTLFMFPCMTGYSFSMALLSMCLVAYSEANL